MSKIRLLCLLAGTVISLSISSAIAATTYTVIDLGVLPGGVSSTATSVDNSGEAVGYTTLGDGSTQAFYWTQAGGMVGLGGVNSRAFGVSNGNVVGITGEDEQAFRWKSGTGIVLLDPEEAGQANGVNAFGKVVGSRANSPANHTALTWSSSNTVSNPFPLNNFTGAAINDLGEFVGINSSSSGYFFDGISPTRINLGSFLPTSISDNRITAGSIGSIAAYEKIDTLGLISIGTLPGDLISDALGINPIGTQIVGVSQGPGGSQGLVYDIATGNLASLTSLLAPAQSGWSVLSGNAINDQGHIAATATFAGVQHAVLLVPEPSTFALASLSLIGLIGRAVVRRSAGRQKPRQSPE